MNHQTNQKRLHLLAPLFLDDSPMGDDLPCALVVAVDAALAKRIDKAIRHVTEGDAYSLTILCPEANVTLLSKVAAQSTDASTANADEGDAVLAVDSIIDLVADGLVDRERDDVFVRDGTRLVSAWIKVHRTQEGKATLHFSVDLCRQVHGRNAEIRVASIAHDADDVAKAVASITGDRPEFRKNLEPLAAISTAHLRPDTLASLGNFCISYENDYGAFIYTVDVDVDVDGERARRADLPEDLRRLLEAAHEAGLVWVKLDGDAQAVEGLPQYP